MARLKLVRDKLLQEMDEQSAIAEALYAENTALAEAGAPLSLYQTPPCALCL